MNNILSQLSGGDLRSIDKTNQVVKQVLSDKSLFDDLFTGLLQDNPVIRMRAADAVEKITKIHPEWLEPYKQKIIMELTLIESKEIRWHIAQLVPRLSLTKPQRTKVARILLGWLHNEKESKIVRVMAMQALADIPTDDIQLRKSIMSEIHKMSKSKTPSLKSRSKKILKQLGKSKITDSKD
jgi:hypothetical protein